MRQYHDLVRSVLEEGNYKQNRTGVDTLSTFGQFYRIDLSKGFPLLTTKKMDGYRWKSLIYELLWYFTGDEHIADLREHTKIWDAWADDAGRLETAYGRFWRRYPVPEQLHHLDGEAWSAADNQWVTREANGRLVFDQIQYVIDTLRGDNPEKDHNSRRLIVNAWHPANAAVSTLPPCHYTYVFNVQGDKLNVHLTQRSGDIALGIPFNIAGYALIAQIIAEQTGFELGHFGHTIVDAHIYCGLDDRGAWYRAHADELAERISTVDDRSEYLEVKAWIDETAPAQEKPYDHIPGLLTQLSREPLPRPQMHIADKPLDDLTFEDFELTGYESHDGLRFAVAE